MRVDEINLFGSFKINGVSPQQSQGIGYSGGTIQWIAVTSSGGGLLGYQGATGPSYSGTVSSYQIGLSNTSSGITSSSSFCFSYQTSTDTCNLTLGLSGGSTRFSTFSVAIVSASSSVNGSLRSFVTSTFDSRICDSDLSGIIGGCFNRLYDSCNSIIIGGSWNCISSNAQFSTIIGGCKNFSSVTCGAIIGGYCNCMDSSYFSPIIGGYFNAQKGAVDSVIISGSTNRICSSTGSVVLGGVGNTINNSQFSAIIGGDFNTITASVYTAIVGATGVTLQNETCVVYFDKLQVLQTVYFTGANPSPENGDLWWDSSIQRMRFRTNNVDYCIEW